MNIYGDARWRGSHGIGRFATQVLQLCPEITPLELAGRPVDAQDPLRLALALRRLPSESIFFSPGYNPPLVSRQPCVLTLHDLNHIDRPENSSMAKRLFYRVVLRPACRRAARLLTVSEYSRQRIVAWAGVPPEKVVNVGNGVDSSFRPAEALPARAGQGYLLCVGNRKGHKNEFRVVEAFARAPLPLAVRLRFTGRPTTALLRHAARCGVLDRVDFTGPLDDGQMPALYRGALALVFPSLYEGFGLPVLESMACGTPVIAANTTALPEVAGDAALLVDPLSVTAIAAAIRRLVADDALRATLRARGLERAAGFTWERTAATVRRVLEEIAHLKVRRQDAAA
jgi:glycosyltransferase involved in cell wall biosynthesis